MDNNPAVYSTLGTVIFSAERSMKGLTEANGILGLLGLMWLPIDWANCIVFRYRSTKLLPRGLFERVGKVTSWVLGLLAKMWELFSWRTVYEARELLKPRLTDPSPYPNQTRQIKEARAHSISRFVSLKINFGLEGLHRSTPHWCHCGHESLKNQLLWMHTVPAWAEIRSRLSAEAGGSISRMLCGARDNLEPTTVQRRRISGRYPTIIVHQAPRRRSYFLHRTSRLEMWKCFEGGGIIASLVKPRSWNHGGTRNKHGRLGQQETCS